MHKLGLVIVTMLFSVTLIPVEISAKDCQYWQSKVGVKNVVAPTESLNEKDPHVVMAAIECLLELEGDTTRGAFGRATHTQVSEALPMATVEVCALYYISKLFYERYDHANGVVLVDANQKWNTKKSIKTAYRSYRKWFDQVKRIGLAEARKQRIDPLADSGITWY